MHLSVHVASVAASVNGSLGSRLTLPFPLPLSLPLSMVLSVHGAFVVLASCWSQKPMRKYMQCLETWALEGGCFACNFPT